MIMGWGPHGCSPVTQVGVFEIQGSMSFRSGCMAGSVWGVPGKFMWFTC